jgi:hypothetical protein
VVAFETNRHRLVVPFTHRLPSEHGLGRLFRRRRQFGLGERPDEIGQLARHALLGRNGDDLVLEIQTIWCWRYKGVFPQMATSLSFCFVMTTLPRSIRLLRFSLHAFCSASENRRTAFGSSLTVFAAPLGCARASLPVRSGDTGLQTWMKQHRRRRATNHGRSLFKTKTYRGTAGGRPWLNDGRGDFVCLPRPFTYHRMLRMPGEAYIVRANVAARGEPATAEKNEERRSDEQWFHVLDPCLPRPRLYG